MAEGVFRHLTAGNESISSIDSCGTAAYHLTDPPDPRTMSVLAEHDITGYRHGARKIHPADFTRFDYILAMDAANLSDLMAVRRRVLKARPGDGETGTAKVMLFGDFGGTLGEEVGDPYYGARDGFEIAYEQMLRFSRGFLQMLDDRPDVDAL